MPKLRLIRRTKYNVRCKPSLRHLYLLLFSSSAFIVLCLYVLNEKTGKSRLVNSSMEEFQTDFLILPKTLPVAARLLTVLIFVPYASLQSRLIIRNTWASTKQKHNASVFFVLGVPDRVTRLEHPINEEANFFNDIIQINTNEYAITNNGVFNWLKRFTSALRFVEANLATSYVLKVGQDTFVNLPKITEYLTTMNVSDHFFATSSSNFFFSNRYGTETTHLLSKYDASAVFAFSFDVLQKLLECSVAADADDDADATMSATESQFFIDCLHHSNVLMRNVNKFRLNSNHVTTCLMNNNFVVHPVSGSEMDTYWTSLKRNEFVC